MCVRRKNTSSPEMQKAPKKGNHHFVNESHKSVSHCPGAEVAFSPRNLKRYYCTLNQNEQFRLNLFWLTTHTYLGEQMVKRQSCGRRKNNNGVHMPYSPPLQAVLAWHQTAFRFHTL